MKLTVFGATGKSGRILVRKALEAGHELTAFARTPEKLDVRHDRLSVVKGDALDAAAVAEAIRGSDAVVSLIGVNPKSLEPVFAASVANIITGMRAAGVRRLVMSAGAGVGDPNDAGGLAGKLIGGLIKLLARRAYEDGLAAAAAIRAAADLDWTMVRLPMLSDEPGGRGSLRIGYLGKGTGPRLSREDLADFMLRELVERRYLRQAPVISN
jgi:putative NADH-flavin reductase